MAQGSRTVRAMAGTAVALVAAFGLAACAGTGHRGHGGRPGPATVALLYSPNGEPLNGGKLGQPSCELATAYWFDRVDANHDGRVERDEFLADARAQFAKMDLDNLGYVTSDELERYRQPYRQGTRQPVTGSPDPVMSADTDLDFKVTLDEFLLQAGATFDRLDTDHSGAIERAELAQLCGAVQQPEERRQPEGGRHDHNRGGSGEPF